MGTHAEDSATLLGAIEGVLEETGIVTSFVVVANYVDTEGARRTYYCGMKGQLSSESIGLLAFVEEYERRSIRDSLGDD